MMFPILEVTYFKKYFFDLSYGSLA